MKSLRESLFGDNITKEYTFGDLFELDEKACHWKNCPLDKQFSAMRIKSKTKVTGSDKCEIIFKGMVKVIEDIKLEGNPNDMDKQWLFCKVEEVVWDFFQYSMVKKRVYVMLINNNHLVLDSDKSLFDDGFDTIQISVGPELNLVFKRK